MNQVKRVKLSFPSPQEQRQKEADTREIYMGKFTHPTPVTRRCINATAVRET